MSPHQQLLNCALQHYQAGEAPRAQALCLQIVREDPQHAEAWNLLGVLAYKTGNVDSALDYFQRAQTAAPENAGYRANFGLVLQALDRLTDPEAHCNLGDALRDLKRFEEAVACYRRTLERRPAAPEIHAGLGSALQELDRFAEAEVCFRRAVELKPDYPEAHHNLGTVLAKLGQIEEPAASFRRALALRPHFPEAHYNLASILLLQGDYEHGWTEYEWRWKQKGRWYRELPAYAQPLWDGSPLTGKTILIHAEQGLGDTLQFVRYLPLVKARGATVVFHGPRQLLAIVHTCAGIDQLIPSDTIPSAFDVHTPLLSLPRLFGTRIDSIPAPVPYLTADPQLIDHWQSRLADTRGFKVGIVWQGNPRYAQPECRTADQRRSIPLAKFEPLARVPGVRLFSLQKGYGTEQLAGLGAGPALGAGLPTPPFAVTALGAGLPTPPFAVTDLGDRLNDFVDTAAVMMNLDLIVSADTSPVHLAGALGVPVWAALPFAGCWRWLLEREDTPWYPTMRLFRQRRPGDWDEVFARMAQELAAFCGEPGRVSAGRALPALTRPGSPE